MSMSINSPAFNNQESIPVKFTCAGSDISPALHWSNIPPAAKSLVLIVDDPDAPDPVAPKMTWVHWVLYNLPPYSKGLDEAIQPNAPVTVDLARLSGDIAIFLNCTPWTPR
jgi:hypothetical protein